MYTQIRHRRTCCFQDIVKNCTITEAINPAGTHWNNVDSTLIQRQDVESTLNWHCFKVLCLTRYTLYIFCHFNKGDYFCGFLFAFLHTNPLLKRVHTLKGKNMVLSGLKQTPCQKGSRVASLVSVSILLETISLSDPFKQIKDTSVWHKREEYWYHPCISGLIRTLTLVCFRHHLGWSFCSADLF